MTQTVSPGTFRLAESFAKIPASPLADLQLAITAGLAKSITKMATPPGMASFTESFAKMTAFPLADLHLGITGKLTESIAQMVTPQLADLHLGLTGGLVESIAKMVTPQLAEALAKLDAASDLTSTSAPRLSSEQERFLCGYIAYVLVCLLVLQVLITMLGADGTLGKVFDIVIGMTGLSGFKLAAIARDWTFKAYEKFQSPGL